MDNYIPSGRGAVRLALSIIFFSSHHLLDDDDDIFNPPRVLRRQSASSRKDEDASLFLPVFLSLVFRARRGKEQTTQQKPSYKNGTNEKASSSSSHSRSKKKQNRRLKKTTTRTINANEFCLFYAQFYVQKRLNDVIFVFFLLCARLRVVSGKRERERESDDGLSVVCGRLSLFSFFVREAKREGKSNTKTNIIIKSFYHAPVY